MKVLWGQTSGAAPLFIFCSPLMLETPVSVGEFSHGPFANHLLTPDLHGEFLFENVLFNKPDDR